MARLGKVTLWLAAACLEGWGPELPCLAASSTLFLHLSLSSALRSCGKIHLETTTHIAAQNQTLVAPLCPPKKTDIEYATGNIKKKTQFPHGNMSQTHCEQLHIAEKIGSSQDSSFC